MIIFFNRKDIEKIAYTLRSYTRKAFWNRCVEFFGLHKEKIIEEKHICNFKNFAQPRSLERRSKIVSNRKFAENFFEVFKPSKTCPNSVLN